MKPTNQLYLRREGNITAWDGAATDLGPGWYLHGITEHNEEATPFATDDESGARSEDSAKAWARGLIDQALDCVVYDWANTQLGLVPMLQERLHRIVIETANRSNVLFDYLGASEVKGILSQLGNPHGLVQIRANELRAGVADEVTYFPVRNIQRIQHTITLGPRWS